MSEQLSTDFLNGDGGEILTGEDKHNIKYLIYTASESYRSIFVEAISKFKIDYWDDSTKPAKELWAEFFSYNMAGNQTNLALLYEYFPEASKALDAYTNTLGEK